MRRGTLSLLGALIAALALGAFGASGATAGGKLTFCSDVTYPPEEFYQGGKPAGSARRMGMSAQVDNTGFDGIIAALLAKKCNAIISGMNDTPERRKQVSFVDYIKVGQSIMVKAGNPEHINSLASLAGKSVAVEVGTTNKTFLDEASKKLKAQGKSAIKVTPFPKDTDAAAALKTGRVDAYFGDSPVVAYYIQKDKAFGFGGAPINPILVGIAIRKDDTATKSGVQKAINAMYKDGTMKKILARWKMTATALKK
ncbi:MAG: ABC transporter substrate-binding protein [Actinobacteria bacterium]|nr:MAG: ABC transporter substrate-binding protein [Actinomycetota bacterium]